MFENWDIRIAHRQCCSSCLPRVKTEHSFSNQAARVSLNFTIASFQKGNLSSDFVLSAEVNDCLRRTIVCPEQLLALLPV